MLLLENKDTSVRNHKGKGRIDLIKKKKKFVHLETINKIK